RALGRQGARARARRKGIRLAREGARRRPGEGVSMEAVARDRVFVPALEAADRARRGEPEWLAARRREARDRFRKLGFPTAKLEEWRTTNIGPILSTPWQPESGEAPAVRAAAGEAGVRVLRLSEALAQEPEIL